MAAQAPLFFLIAGEASGDLLGAHLMRALRVKANGEVRFFGVGGPRMREEGLELLFDQTELAHMGLFELVRALPQLLARINETAASVRAKHPAALITIDSPDFCFRVAKKLKGEGIPLIHYVAPSVWAWRPGRAKKVATFLDHLLALLPFEPPYFTVHGLPCTFVGHPLVESDAGKGDAGRFRAREGLASDVPLLALLPGSRAGEIRCLLPIFAETVALLQKSHADLQLVVPTVPATASLVRGEVKSWGIPVHFIETDADKYDAFAASRAALACSGTVSVELALAGLPTVIAYRANPLTVALYRHFIKTKYATLINIMRDRMIMPEFLQEYCKPHALANAVDLYMTSEKARAEQKAELESLSVWLGRGQFVPSEKAAETVWEAAFPARQKRRILQVIPSLGSGGAEQGCVDIAAALVTRGDRAFVASTGGWRVEALEKAGGVFIAHDVKTKNPFKIWRNAAWLAALIRRERIDIVHVRSRAPAWSVWLACRRTGCPWISTFHAAYTVSNGFKKIYNAVMAKADRMIAISPFIERYILLHYDPSPENVALINRGVDIEALDPKNVSEENRAAFEEKAGLASGEKAIVMPARLSPIKGQNVLLAAAGLLKAQGLALPKILLIGDDQGRVGYTQKLKTIIAALELGSVVKLVGAWSDMPAAYAAARLVIVPSIKPEGFGRVPVEAMASAVPVIASHIGAMSDTVVDGQTGWLVTPDDPEALAAAMQKALAATDEERAAMGEAGRQRAASLYDKKRMIEQTLALYDSLAERKGHF